MDPGKTRDYDLVLLGATGYTGRLCAEHIHTKLPIDLRWAIAGRNKKKLELIIERLKNLNTARPPPVIELVDLLDEPIEQLVKRTRVVITTVGPYQRHGRLIFKACASAGTHYLDCTGETPWLLKMIQEFHDLAHRTGAIMIPSCGFESVPSDISVFAATNYIRTQFSAETENVDFCIHSFQGQFSGGTMETALNVFDTSTARELKDCFLPYALSPKEPPPNAERAATNKPNFGLWHVPELGWLGLGLQGPVDLAYVHRTWGLLAENSNTTYGDSFSFNPGMRVAGPIRGILWNIGLTTATLLALLRPFRWLLRKIWYAPGEGPGEDSMKKSRFEYRTVATAKNETKDKVMVKLRFNGDVYTFTALCLCEAAMVLLKHNDTEAHKQGGGVLTNALLGKRYIDRLRDALVKIETAELK